jgi:multidrug transporter EmrE-like cation transporter
MPDNSTEPKKPQYLEVWGDTVTGRHLGLSVIIGVAVALGAYLAANVFFSRTVEEEALAGAYSLLVGIGACVVGGVVCGKLFPPKRRIVTEAAEGDSVGDVIEVLRAERGGLGSVDDLPEPTVRELKDLNLYDRFKAAERPTEEPPK